MPLTKAQIQTDGGRAFTDFPTESITIAGVSYGCLVLNQQTASNWDIGGEVKTRELSVLLKRDDISTMPAEGDSATFNNQTLRVVDVEQDDLAAPVEVKLNVPEA